MELFHQKINGSVDYNWASESFQFYFLKNLGDELEDFESIARKHFVKLKCKLNMKFNQLFCSTWLFLLC